MRPIGSGGSRAVLDELDFVKAQLARLATSRNQAFAPLRIIVLTAFSTAALLIIWCEVFWRYCFCDKRECHVRRVRFQMPYLYRCRRGAFRILESTAFN